MASVDRSVLLTRIVLVVYVLVISVLAFFPSTELPSLDVSDKTEHFAAFIVLAFISDMAFPELKARLGLLAAVAAFGVVIELVQISLPTREFSWLDIVADSLGVFLYKLGREIVRNFQSGVTQ